MTNQKQNIDNHVFLIGRPPMSEFLGVVNSTIDYEHSQLTQLADEWRTANQHINELQKTQANIVDKAGYKDVPKSLESLANQVLDDKIFQRAFNIVKPVIRMVELDSLVVFQKHINLNYVDGIKKQLGSSPDEVAVFKMCLPVDHPLPAISATRVSNDSFVFVSSSADVRVLDMALLDGEQIQNYSTTGPIASVLGFVVGSGSNCLNALYINGRMILNNGSHRAYALRSMGFTHVPCIVQQVLSIDELDVVATAEFLQNPAAYLETARPALLQDYFDEKLIKVLPVQRKKRQIKISYKIETIDVPDI